MNNHFSGTAIVVNSNGIGHADEGLRHKLAGNYFRTLLELGHIPQSVLFYAEGVKLVTPESSCLPELSELAAAGATLIACRTCLDFYGLMESVAVGEIGNMVRIVEAQVSAAKVITL